jgi:hypothetical protein
MCMCGEVRFQNLRFLDLHLMGYEIVADSTKEE